MAKTATIFSFSAVAYDGNDCDNIRDVTYGFFEWAVSIEGPTPLNSISLNVTMHNSPSGDMAIDGTMRKLSMAVPDRDIALKANGMVRAKYRNGVRFWDWNQFKPGCPPCVPSNISAADAKRLVIYNAKTYEPIDYSIEEVTKWVTP